MRVSTRAGLILALLCLWSPRAQGGYLDLKTQFEQYQPPAYLFQIPRSSTAKMPQSDPFEMEKQRLTDLQSALLRTLKDTPDQTRFYYQNPQLSIMLEAATKNERVAQDAIHHRFTQERLEILTLLRHPGIKAAEKRVKATLEQFTQITSVNEILRQYTAFTEDVMTGVGPMRGKDAITTKFPFPGILALKGQVVRQDVLSALEHLEAVRRDAITSARKHHWQLWFIRRAQAITAQTIVLLKDLEAVARTRFEAGKTSFQDVIKVQIKRELLEEKLTTLREQQRNEKVHIQQLLDLSPNADVGIPKVSLAEAKLPAIEALYRLAIERRQELRRLRTRIGKMERMIEMAETMILPSFTLGLSHYQDEAVKQVGWMARRSTFATSPSATMGSGLPKQPGFGMADAYIREIRQKRQAMQDALSQMEATTIAKVRKTWFAVDQAAREKRLYQHTLLGLSQAALEASTSGYESGRASFSDVISSFTLWLDTHLALANRQSRYAMSLAELEQAVGQAFTQQPKPSVE